MKKLDKQALALFAVVEAGMTTSLQCEIGDSTLRTHMGSVRDTMAALIEREVKKPGMEKARRWATRRTKEWADGLGEYDKDSSLSTLAALSYRALTDIEARLPAGVRRTTLLSILPKVDEVSLFYGTQGSASDYRHEEEVDEILDALYGDIGFRP